MLSAVEKTRPKRVRSAKRATRHLVMQRQHRLAERLLAQHPWVLTESSEQHVRARMYHLARQLFGRASASRIVRQRGADAEDYTL